MTWNTHLHCLIKRQQIFWILIKKCVKTYCFWWQTAHYCLSREDWVDQGCHLLFMSGSRLLLSTGKSLDQMLCLYMFNSEIFDYFIIILTYLRSICSQKNLWLSTWAPNLELLEIVCNPCVFGLMFRWLLLRMATLQFWLSYLQPFFVHTFVSTLLVWCVKWCPRVSLH